MLDIYYVFLSLVDTGLRHKREGVATCCHSKAPCSGTFCQRMLCDDIMESECNRTRESVGLSERFISCG